MPFIAWLYMSARNALIDHYRTRKEVVALDDIVARSSDGTAPEEAAELRIETESLRAAMRTLTEEQQQVIVLKFIAGMTTDEIASQLGKRAGAVRALQMRALQAHARLMEEEEFI